MASRGDSKGASRVNPVVTSIQGVGLRLDLYNEESRRIVNLAGQLAAERHPVYRPGSTRFLEDVTVTVADLRRASRLLRPTQSSSGTFSPALIRRLERIAAESVIRPEDIDVVLATKR